ncbi:MAG TPA: DoxX family protein, partial [Nocardioidaceae bacterium]|nr:DoxX family protein [Nocardioidaceae bacterium]
APGAPIPTNPATWVRINGAVNVAGAAMLVSGRFPRLAATVLAANLVPATLTDHAFWAEPDPTLRATQRRHFVKNLSVAGGLVMAAAAPRGTKRSARSARSKSKQDAG